MKKKQSSPKEFRERWWWTQTEIQKRGVHGIDWPLDEEAARNYELMRRAPKGAKQFPKTYLDLNDNEKVFVRCLWCNWPKNPSRIVTDRAQFDEIGWTTAYENQRTQWNLRASNSVLKKAFMHEIEVSRAIQKIGPQHGLKGKNNRGASWRYIELLDRPTNERATLTASERHIASDGRKMAAKFFEEFHRALMDWKKSAKNMRNCRLLKRSKMVDFTKPPVPGHKINWKNAKHCKLSEFFNFQLIHS